MMVGFSFGRAVMIPLFLAVSAPVLTACQTPPASLLPGDEAALLTVTGSATYRERMAAPKGSVLTVELSDTSLADAPSVLITDWSTGLDDGGVPRTFTLRVNQPLDPRHTYTLRAAITGPQGELLWTTDTVHRITALAGTADAGELVMIKVQPAPAAALPDLTGKDFTVTAIGGTPTVGERLPTLNFRKDGNAGGFGSCNSYGGSFTQAGDKVTFGDIVSTMMGCVDQRIGQQEGRLYAALKGTATLSAGEQGAVILTGEDGTQLTLTPAGMTSLAGTRWLVEAMGGTGIVAGHEPQINFDENGKINGTTGCNRFFGGYGQDGAALTFTGVGMTKMACMAEGVMQQESAFGRILSGKAEGSVDAHGNLTVRGADGVSFTARPLPADGEQQEGNPADIAGGTWQVEDLNRGGIIDNTVMTLTFTADGIVSGSSHCNSLSGSYTATAATLTFTPMVMTQRACLAEALGNQERRFVDALQGDMNWRLTADGALELTREGGHRILLRR